MTNPPAQTWPQIRTAGFDGFLISFGTELSETANRAALAFRAAIDRAGWDGVAESSTSLVSAYLRFDPLAVDHAAIHARLGKLLEAQDWYAAPLPSGRNFWRVPVCFGDAQGPQLEEAAQLAGLSVSDAIADLCGTRLRVQTIGFAPGMPYLGALPEVWDIPRQAGLTAQVPAGGLCVAIRQMVLFPVATPTGWRQVGQSALSLFRPDAEEPFLLRPGDEVQFYPVSAEALARMRDDGHGGAVSETIQCPAS